jgi:hypothetical protein
LLERHAGRARRRCVARVQGRRIRSALKFFRF